MALLIREAEVSALLTMDESIAAVREILLLQGRGPLAEQPRRRVRTSGAILAAMFAEHPARRLLGGKVYVSTASGTRFLVQVFDAQKGRLVALVEGNRLGQLRTGAASGVAADVLARKDARSIGMIGAGYQAETQLEAVSRVRHLQRATVYARDPQKLAAFCRRMQERLGLEVVPAARPEDAVHGHEIVVTATTAKEPVLFGKDIEPGQHICAVGSNRSTDRELDDRAVQRVALVAVDSRETAALEAGDLGSLRARGEIDIQELPTLGEIVAGVRPGRRHPDDVTLFLSQGIAAWDLAVAAVVIDKARAQGVGQEVDFLP